MKPSFVLAFALAACRRAPVTPLVVPDQMHARGALGDPLDPAARAEAVRQILANFERVHFEVDSASLDDDGRRALDANAALLRRFGDLRVEVQGHADARGTVDYNLALGQRRADAVVDRLVASGVSPSRLAIVSYGEERPLATGSGETAWAENRRAEFRVIAGSSAVAGTTTE